MDTVQQQVSIKHHNGFVDVAHPEPSHISPRIQYLAVSIFRCFRCVLEIFYFFPLWQGVPLYISVCMHAAMHACVCACACVRMCVCVRVYAWMWACILVRACVTVRVCVSVSVYAYIHVRVSGRAWAYVPLTEVPQMRRRKQDAEIRAQIYTIDVNRNQSNTVIRFLTADELVGFVLSQHLHASFFFAETEHY